MLPPVWQKITLFNPVVYLISGFRWSFYGIAMERRRQLGMTGVHGDAPVIVAWIFRTGLSG
jgi:ABC-2 type transport system permease protein